MISAQQVQFDVTLAELIPAGEITPSLGYTAFAILLLAAVCCAGIVGGTPPADLAGMTVLP